MDLTPKRRDALILRKVELNAIMDHLRSALNETNADEWTALYLEREAIDEQLGDED